MFYHNDKTTKIFEKHGFIQISKNRSSMSQSNCQEYIICLSIDSFMCNIDLFLLTWPMHF